MIVYHHRRLLLLLQLLYRFHLLIVFSVPSRSKYKTQHRDEVCKAQNNDFEYTKNIVVNLRSVALRIQNVHDNFEEKVDNERPGECRGVGAWLRGNIS